jgi:amidophosphoribosyltransferase
MGGFFGVVSRDDRVADLFYGTDYHSHLGTSRGGMVMRVENGFKRNIHDISNTPFRTKFEEDLPKYSGGLGLGVISDYEDQPLLVASHHGRYAIITVGRVDNLEPLAKESLGRNGSHFSELKGNEFNQTEIVANLINREDTFVDGLQAVHEKVAGSCSVLLLTEDAVYASRGAQERLGRRDPRDLCVLQPRLRGGPRDGPCRDREDHTGRGRAALAAGREDADLLVPLGLLRLPGVELRGHQRGDGA